MSTYEQVMLFEKKYPGTIAWRVKKHAKVVDEYLNPGEVVTFAFAAQKNDKFYDIFNLSRKLDKKRKRSVDPKIECLPFLNGTFNS